jgi:xanthine dehydrogenase YagT iron-sulfur-binding subunit
MADDDDADEISRRGLLATAAAAAAAVPLLDGCAHEPATAARPASHVEASSPRSRGSGGPMTRPQPATGAIPLTLKINGREHAVELEPRVTLLDALREHIGLTGTKKGCDHGQCGACTVLLSGRRVDSCLLLAIMANGQDIITIEGLSQGDGQLHPIQSAFIEHDAFQCGYCTPGQICSAVGLLREGHCKSDDDIREAMSGNLCRCGAYPNIVAAVRQVLDQQA